jgi:hypothetical protein
VWQRQFVYFIACEQFVKIGVSSSPWYRPRALATGNPFACRLIGLIEGGHATEVALHRRFAEHRHRLEWFRLTDDLRDSIAELCGNDWRRLAGGEPLRDALDRIWSAPTSCSMPGTLVPQQETKG